MERNFVWKETMNARLESTNLELFPADAAAELAYAKTLTDGMELSPEAQALYEKEGAERFRQFHGRRVLRLEVTKEQKESIDAAWRICAYPGGRVIHSADWCRRFDDAVTDILGFSPPDEYTLVEKKESN
ncbi:hypothetical protein KDW55_02235 [Burkholderia sp. AU19243]|uniref:hypothetical protein n=1 Tax=Burkholderia sp. AU19243 TaxID=2824810 RepID=UPI001B914E10|nr:hypothetical protein [Burkholderia sp. AU19243]MBR8362136.1 hypothetical protein [Burkholderia sp. AU19243]